MAASVQPFSFRPLCHVLHDRRARDFASATLSAHLSGWVTAHIGPCILHWAISQEGRCRTAQQLRAVGLETTMQTSDSAFRRSRKDAAKHLSQGTVH